MHVPADGRPLPGYNQAIADSKKRTGSRTIEIAATVDEDDGEETAALLAVPSSRAEGAIRRNLTQNTTDRETTEKGNFADLSTLAIPVPTLRAQPALNGHETDLIQTASIGETSPIRVIEAPRVFGEPKPAAMTLSKGVVEELPFSAPRELQAGIGRITARRLMSWALHVPGQMQALSAPRVAGQTILRNAGL